MTYEKSTTRTSKTFKEVKGEPRGGVEELSGIDTYMTGQTSKRSKDGGLSNLFLFLFCSFSSWVNRTVIVLVFPGGTAS